MTPPAVSRPRERGVTSSSSRSCTFSLPSPDRMAACRHRGRVSRGSRRHLWACLTHCLLAVEGIDADHGASPNVMHAACETTTSQQQGSLGRKMRLLRVLAFQPEVVLAAGGAQAGPWSSQQR